MRNQYYVYILASQKYGTLYIGVTNNLIKRVYEHKMHKIKGFTSTYNVTKLVYYEEYSDVNDAISSEKRLKAWHRDWKNNQIEILNPDWNDLYPKLCR
ncbi:MAG: GIY-YIG nuclease family protein [Candidatus Roizmanbacteria bacterium]